MDDILRGKLRASSDAPGTGETTDTIAHVGDAVVQQILSGRLDAPVDYRAPVDEWVVVLAGSARLEVDGAQLDLETGDWLLLPAGTPHRLLGTDAGTSWLTVTATV
jgi:mannose-6-phosphate isomerase-like protein (cupin superfamily)